MKQAIDATTSSEELRKLADNHNGAVRKLVASNPNTPPDLLVELFIEYPHQVLNNPVIELLLLENPDFFKELYQNNPYIFNEDALPSLFKEWAVNCSDEGIRKNLASNENTHESLLVKLAKDTSVEVRCHVAGNHRTNPDTLKQLAEDKSKKVRLAVAENKNIPICALLKLATDKSYEVRSKVAAHTKTPSDILEKLIQDSNGIVRFGAARNPNTPQNSVNKLLEKLIRHDIRIIQEYKLPQSFLEWAVNHQDTNIRVAVACNSNTPQSLLMQLAQDKEICVRTAVAKNSKSSRKTLTKLSQDENETICFIAAWTLQERSEYYYFDYDENPF
ncbi:leucine rich repeat variant [Calothrix sp. NIES-4071]|nr:leucine rich repeat variant [Calothrix sp. NIES-4071]BAZ63499.1 leucine rich repeat variant [Calothrix sp. NIES-4105]